MDAMSETPEGVAKLGKYEERVDRALAERIRASDEQTSPARDDGNPDVETPAWPEERTMQMRAEAMARRDELEKRWEIERDGAPGYDTPRGTEQDVPEERSGPHAPEARDMGRCSEEQDEDKVQKAKKHSWMMTMT